MNDAVRRALRSFLQGFVTALISSGILSALSETSVVDWSGLKKVGISTLSAGLLSLVVFIQNTLEDKKIIPEVISK